MARLLRRSSVTPDPPTEIDILYIKYTTRRPLRGPRLRVLYLGISNTPAWIVTAANTYAKGQGKTQFSVSSGQWSVLVRDLEREIIPMARGFDMAISPGEVLGAGKFQIPEEVEQRKKAGKTFRPFGGGGQVTKFGLGNPSGNIGDDLNMGVRRERHAIESSFDISAGGCQITR
ncbi:hypothetical protein CHGG_07531 [Chaetomium globosum CBS 148.51]|uniref:Uncharacterized protein n=1 Tax=Chaetomium globosum (strain ATCC 6205 / CBS 148.51 / DSM 1962 / NBRC 6347 / NRRL 1970) TaxID=306901 RepID=Q2GWX3_CHAGB|nr:uncharacterized protein CHGG_07531 [Chaetomium globosum CBS 148.51]EAQ86278.1 hypothetical protein CHGG_07531 [Chaetomium globosum CBS 148.51]